LLSLPCPITDEKVAASAMEVLAIITFFLYSIMFLFEWLRM
jgi:hypothetical protein